MNELQNKASAQPELPRGFGLWTGLFVVIASMVGVGILTTSGYTIHATGSHTALLLLWALGGLLALCGALTVTELATAVPHVGGDYVFVRMAFGPEWGFTYGWATFLCGFAGPIAVVAHAACEYILLAVRPLAGQRWPLLDELIYHPGRVATIVVIVLTFLHCQGQRQSAFVQNAMTVFKIVTLLGLVIVGLLSPYGRMSHLVAGTPLTEVALSPLAVGLIYVMYSYTGWNAAAYLAGEIANPPRNLPRCLIGGCLAVTVLYLLLNLTYAYALEPAEVQQLPIQRVEAIAELAAVKLLGPQIAMPLSVIIGVGVLASLSAFILTGPRVALAMSRDGLLPPIAGQVHASRGTPIPAMVLQAIVAVTLLQFSKFQALLDMTSVGLAVMSGLMVCSIFVLRSRPDLEFPFRMPLYPLPPLLFLGFTVWMVVYTVASKPTESLICLIGIFAAVPLYHLLRVSRSS